MRRALDVIHELLGEDLAPFHIISKARLDAGLSQQEVADITGIKRPNLSALERGKIEMTKHYAEILAVVYKIHPADILYPNRNFKVSPDLKRMIKRTEKVINSKKES
ncbi:MAG: XRE family transcriptional regulator [Deltaproteobacteria bacterium]|nr:MAG: XRE family transcriptional regulator [Deltaproteobacteria bacterium]